MPPPPSDHRADGDRVLLRAARGSAVRLAVLALLGLAGAGLGLWLPAALGHALDLLLHGRPAGNRIAVCAAIVAGQVLLAAGADMLGATTAARVTAGLRRRAVRRLLAAGPAATAARPGAQPAAGPGLGEGDVVTRLVGNAADAGSAPVAAAAVPASLAVPVGGVVALGLTDPWLAA
ncbi:ATP-binding cassette, subfamily B, partial [Streptomyces sp. DvalAA-14]